jgi:hypothetical protein
MNDVCLTVRLGVYAFYSSVFSFTGLFFMLKSLCLKSVFRIRIHWIHMFLGLPDPYPLVRGMDPDVDRSVIKQK